MAFEDKVLISPACRAVLSRLDEQFGPTSGPLIQITQYLILLEKTLRSTKAIEYVLLSMEHDLKMNTFTVSDFHGNKLKDLVPMYLLKMQSHNWFSKQMIKLNFDQKTINLLNTKLKDHSSVRTSVRALPGCELHVLDVQWKVGLAESAVKFCFLWERLEFGDQYRGTLNNGVKNKKPWDEVASYNPFAEDFEDIVTLKKQEAEDSLKKLMPKEDDDDGPGDDDNDANNVGNAVGDAAESQAVANDEDPPEAVELAALETDERRVWTERAEDCWRQCITILDFPEDFDDQKACVRDHVLGMMQGSNQGLIMHSADLNLDGESVCAPQRRPVSFQESRFTKAVHAVLDARGKEPGSSIGYGEFAFITRFMC